MITKARIVTSINNIRDKTPVKFKSFGSFLLRLMLLSVEDQEYVVDSLAEAAKHTKASDRIVIVDIRRTVSIVSKVDFIYRFVIHHEFKCRTCGFLSEDETNVCNKRFGILCDQCQDRLYEYRMDVSGETNEDES